MREISCYESLEQLTPRIILEKFSCKAVNPGKLTQSKVQQLVAL